MQGREHASPVGLGLCAEEIRVCDPFSSARLRRSWSGPAASRCAGAAPTRRWTAPTSSSRASRRDNAAVRGDAAGRRRFIAAIGSSLPNTRELDDAALARASLVAVDWAQQAMEEAGDIVLADRASLPTEKVVELPTS